MADLTTAPPDVDPIQSWDPMAVTAAEVMSAPVVTLAADESLSAAWDLLFTRGIHHLVVTRRGRCVAGVLDDRRLAQEWPAGPLTAHRRRIGDVIGRRVHCVLPDTPLAVVAETMAREGLDATPVVLADGTPVGIVTSGDIVTFVGRAHRRIGPAG